MAVWSNDENVDPIGACVGPHGQRVNSIVEELRGEKIDIIKYSDDPAEYIAAALAPARNPLSLTKSLLAFSKPLLNLFYSILWFHSGSRLVPFWFRGRADGHSGKGKKGGDGK
jgi:hypothetical protein